MDSTDRSKQPRVISVGYRLPKKDLTTFQEKTTTLLSQDRDVLWVGYCGASSPDELQNAEPVRTENAVPIYIDTEIAKANFAGFCKGVIWPLFHYYENVQEQFSPENWKAYQTVNQLFADTIASIYKEGDLIFIQDYHLLLLPALLRKKLPNAKIGLFLHIPWPSSELYRSLPVRSEILLGALEADLIGFQTFSYSRHFFSACTRLLGVYSDDRGVRTSTGHFARIEVVPVGINPRECIETLAKPEVKERVDQLKKLFEGKKIIVSRDTMEYTKGVPCKLKAFEAFLEAHPEWREKVILFQECRPNTEIDRSSNMDLVTEIERFVGSINGKYGTINYTPVYYLYQNLKWEETCALFSVADGALITPLRDGMNLSSHEFVACQQDKMSPLILSEFAGSAQSLSGAILVNPWDQKQIIKSLCKVLTMPEEQKKIRHKHNYEYVMSHDACFWIESFIKSLSRTKEDLETEMNKSCMLANIDEIVDAYKKSSKRILLFDYDGTLTPIVRIPRDAIPTKELLSTLKQLALEEKNRTYIISGRDRKAFNEWFENIPVGMSCEHGAFFRPWLPNGGGIGSWVDVGSELDLSWRDTIQLLFEDYAERVPGSFVEVKEFSLTWHYRNADIDFGEHQKNDLLLHLQNLSSLPIDILDGKKAVEVRPQGINKGSSVKRIVSSDSDADFILCIGDDTTDEDMFEEVQKYDTKHKYTITICEKTASFSNYYLKDQRSVVELLRKLIRAGNQM